MTEEEARSAIEQRFGEDSARRVGAFLSLVIEENGSQNLISPATVGQIWKRHALDSAQLIAFGRDGLWIDVGTGGGFPGIIIALLRPEPIMLVEPRSRRAEFLQRCVGELELRNARVVAGKVEQVRERAATISARAVASVGKLFQLAEGCSNPTTRWILPRGRITQTDIDAAHKEWRGVFHVEQSLTDPASSILVVDEVSRR